MNDDNFPNRSTMQVPATSEEIGISVKVGEKDKVDHYERHYTFPNGVKFIPFAIDTHGRWNDAFKNYIKALCLKKAKGKVESPIYGVTLARIIRRISIAHAKSVGQRLQMAVDKCTERCEDPEMLAKFSRRGYR